MFCINCFNRSTQVTNSRPNKKDPLVWRRRHCQACAATFTTYERPSLADNQPIYLADGTSEQFNLGRLIVSIAAAFTHSEHDAKYNALWIAYTVESTLSSQRQTITRDDIAATTHGILRQYDELAALQYAAKHQLVEATRQRRGRPSVKSKQPD
jgi:transcriptional regulator NrdR family protein